MSAKSTDTIDPNQIDWNTLKQEDLEALNDYIRRYLSKKEIGKIAFRVMGNLVLAPNQDTVIRCESRTPRTHK